MRCCVFSLFDVLIDNLSLVNEKALPEKKILQKELHILKNYNKEYNHY